MDKIERNRRNIERFRGKKFSFSCMNFYYFNDEGKIVNDVAAKGLLEAIGLRLK